MFPVNWQNFFDALQQIFGLIATILGICFSVNTAYKYFHSKSRVTALEETAKEHLAMIEKNAEDIEALNDRMFVSEKDRKEIHETNRLILTSVRALLGGDPEAMKRADNEIDEFLGKKV